MPFDTETRAFIKLTKANTNSAPLYVDADAVDAIEGRVSMPSGDNGKAIVHVGTKQWDVQETPQQVIEKMTELLNAIGTGNLSG